MKKSNITSILFYVISAELIGALSAWISGDFTEFFERYNNPPLQPPAWLFPVVWIILYAAMGYSAYLINSSAASRDAKMRAMQIYWGQLAVNFLWSIVFFRLEALWLAFTVIIVLTALIALMIYDFKKIKPAAACINIPYLLWVLFAVYLNFATALIN